ncbi:glycosyltransferase [Patescibacteria group bacterium]|nr:glycosyltransferase [Patescibacteria group bacterium]
MSNYNVLHLTPSVSPAACGLAHISINLAQAQYALGHNVTIWCFDSKENIAWGSETSGFPPDRINGFKLVGPKSLYFSPQMSQNAVNLSNDRFNIVHQHGIWTGVSRATLKINKRHKTPTIIAPHGCLNHWALNLSRWKKRIALTAYERKNLVHASCLHATSETEIADFRDFGLTNPIAFIENGVMEKHLSMEGNANRFREQNAIAFDKRLLFFLSRITPKKGLIMLVEAIIRIKDDFKDWQLIIAGMDEFNHKVEVESLIKQLKLEDKIKIIGPLFDQAKADAFAAAELFILPSHSEGSPLIVLESLAAGVPVITTKASTWSNLTVHNCGWWVDINTQAIVVALQEAVSMSAEELRKMGMCGKHLIASRYTWPQLAQKTIWLYDWLLGQSDKPDFVILD